MPVDETKLAEVDEAYKALSGPDKKQFLDLIKDYGNPLEIRSFDTFRCEKFHGEFADQTRCMLGMEDGLAEITNRLLECDPQTLLHALKKGDMGADLRRHVDTEDERKKVKYGDRPDVRQEVEDGAKLRLKHFRDAAPDAELEKKLQAALRQAKMILMEAELKLRMADPSKIPSVTKEVLKYHMKWADEDFTRENLIALGETLGKMKAGLGNQVQISDGGRRAGGAPGFVSYYPHNDEPMARGTFDEAQVAAKGYALHEKPDGNFMVMGNIHLSFEKAKNLNTSQLATILIHEASHKYLMTDDVAYAHGTVSKPVEVYRGLTKSESARNADSYSMTATCLERGKLFEDTYQVTNKAGDNAISPAVSL